jgi:hypothetical protein
MAENITIIRLELTNVGNVASTLSPNEVSPGNLKDLASGIVGGALAAGYLKHSFGDSMLGSTQTSGTPGGVISEKIRYPNRLARREALQMGKNIRTEAWKHLDFNAWKIGAEMGIRNMGAREFKKGSLGVMGLAVAGYNMYSQHKVIGYNLSGASHSAQVQQRKAQAVNRMSSIAGAAILNPWLAVGMIAHRGWELAQQNRQELYQIRSSQIIAGVMQERLVQNTIQRRF